MKRLFCLVLSTLALAVLAAPAGADPVAADPYAITPEVGPWVICAASYMGEDSLNLAHQMVEHLRTDYHLPAYLFDRGDAERQAYLEEHRQKEAYYGGIHLPFRHPKFTPSCAVLIGGYPDVESANSALLKVKKLQAPTIKLSSCTGKETKITRTMKWCG
jgi:hypothetical protein